MPPTVVKSKFVCLCDLKLLRYRYVFPSDSHLDKLHEAVAGVLADPFFSLPTEEAELCLKGARDMMQALKQPNEAYAYCVEFSRWLVTSLSAVVQSAKRHSQLDKEKLWIKFHELTVSIAFAKKWEDFGVTLHVRTIPPLLYQHITDVLFEATIKECVSSATSQSAIGGAIDTAVLTYEEENAVYYIGGYVVHELKKDQCNKQMVPLLEMLTEAGSRTDNDECRHWTSSVNRGGLTMITDEAFRCFRDIELHICRYLRVENTRDMNEEFAKKVQDSVLSDDDLLFDWCMAIEFTADQEVADKCLEKIVKNGFLSEETHSLLT